MENRGLFHKFSKGNFIFIYDNKMYSSMFHPMCYQMHCSSSFLTVQINDDYIVCPRQGGNVQLKGYDGLLHCPDYNLICTGTVLCNDMFDWLEKKSSLIIICLSTQEKLKNMA